MEKYNRKPKVAWNKERTASVVLSKLKEFTLLQGPYQWILKGWFNKENSFSFGSFDTKAEAEKFLENIHTLL